MHQTIEFLDKQIKDPSQGLPEEIFLFVSRLTPMVNVDLLIKDENDRRLLAWRNDQYCGMGWHIVGGVVRFKETLETRIQQVAESEIGTNVQFDPTPLAVSQVFRPQKTRGHFISLLYNCSLSGKFIPKNNGLKKTDQGYLMWHDRWPENMVESQKNIYNHIIKNDK